jgi:indolepyruvate ferredoxin oxidoreductase alpha subunit
MEGFTGLDAARLAVRDAEVEVITYVPGYPITELAGALGAEIVVNEKVALEIALGASATGARSLVVVKQVGMNVLADPLVISATHSIGSGLVVLVGDDLGPRGSQSEMDSRFYGPLTGLPVLDPKDPAALYSSIQEAYLLSESLRIPVIVRITHRLMSARGQAPPLTLLKCTGQVFDKAAWDLTARGRHQKQHQEIQPLAQEASEVTHLNLLQASGEVGIIASGFPASLGEGLGVSVLSLGYAHPLPWKLIRRFIDGHSQVLVAEEPEPFIESQLRLSPKVRGKLTGHLPFGSLERSDLIKALEDLGKYRAEGEPSVYESVVERGYKGICDDCPFIPLYKVLGRLEVPVAGDAGCAIRATREPYSSVDVVYGLGSSIGVASGFRKKGVAVIGDFAFAHTGLAGLVNAVWQKRNVLVVLLQNGVAATTGGQETPDLTGLLEALVPTRSIQLPLSEDEIRCLLEEELARPGASAVLATGRCARSDPRRSP